MNKKTKIIIIIILIMLLISMIAIADKDNKGNETNNKETIQQTSQKETIDVTQVIDIEDINTSKYTITKNTNLTIATKYSTGKNIYELEVNAKLEEITGKMIYVRELNTELNVFQTQYQINEEDNIDAQITQIMEEFKRTCKRYANIDIEGQAISENLYGESKEEDEIPLSESIYNENRLYSETYEVKQEEESKETKTYDMNFYRTGNELTCELVYVIK